MSRSFRFGELPDGQVVMAHELRAGSLAVTILELGATIQSLVVGDRTESIVLGYDDVTGYVASDNPYHGAVVGRYANRIAGGRFSLDGVTHQLSANEGTTCLHGGRDGFHARLWSVVTQDDSSLTLELTSPDGDQGFPGRLEARARYELTAGSLALTLTATTDQPTVVSLTNHSYLNLAGHGRGTVDHHVLSVEADHYLPVDDHSIPVGDLAPVTGTPFDLREPVYVGERVGAPHDQVRLVRGIDHAFHLRGTGLRRVATLSHPGSGLSLDLHTDQPSLQVYTGNFLDGSSAGHGGRWFRQGDGIALETQRHPDAPNQPALGDAVLRPGEVYSAQTVWQIRA